ncbi:MAG TPA: branched-chain amino acid ABC transporter permease [Burkholderiales bacterium]|jgi:branched-chain amino acid transport system permease protein|nr:branched-chain amino acid ABC transporter permease [Burkholderiales bacterium]
MLGWVDTIIQGILLGGLYALFAMGLSLIFGVMRLVNIAHGDLIVLAAYLALVTADSTGLSPLAALAVCVPAMFMLGYVLQRGLLNFTLGTDILPPLLVTFGLSIIIQNALLETFSADPRSLKLGGFETGSFHLGADIAVGYFPLLVLAVAIVLTALLELAFGRTALGRAFRATSDDPEAVQLMGVNDRHVYALATGIALAIVAVAAVFYGIRTTFAPTDGPDRLLFAFEAVIIGGLGSFWGTLVGGIVLGMAQAIGFRIDPGWGVLAGHLAFLAVLLFKPGGLFPKTR